MFFPPICYSAFYTQDSIYHLVSNYYQSYKKCLGGEGRNSGGSGVGGSTLESPRKKTRKFKKQPPPPDQTPISSRETGGNAVVDLLLDISSQMEAMEEFVSQHTLPQSNGEQGADSRG